MAKKEVVNPLHGLKDILKEIDDSSDVLVDKNEFRQCFPIEDNKACLNMIIPTDFIKTKINHIHDRLFSSDRSLLSNFLTGAKKNGIVSVRDEIAMILSNNYQCYCNVLNLQKYEKIFGSDNISSTFTLEKLPTVYSGLTTLQEKSKGKNSNSKHEDYYLLDYIKKYILYLYGTKKYSQFFQLLFLFSLLQSSMTHLSTKLPKNQYKQISEYLDRLLGEANNSIRKTATICVEKGFWDLRRELVKSAKGHLIIAGASLREAFRRGDSNSILEELKYAIRNHQITRLTILLTDPLIFEESGECGQPIRDIDEAIKSLQEHIYREIYEEKMRQSTDISLHIYFLPFLQIDHAVITEEFMAFRSNKLWNYDRFYKGSFMLHAAEYYYNSETSEYKAHYDYLNMIIANSTIIYPDVDVDDPLPERFSARSYHMEWREFLRNSPFDNIYLHKVYEKQIFNYVCNTWSSDGGRVGEFTPSSTISSYSDLYKPENLLNDDTQRVLLPYIQETERLFTEAIKKHDQGENKCCHIVPSLDLGFPNNVQRLAGGFATGMLVTWQCGIDMVPVDATVNICTSSVFKLDKIDDNWISDSSSFCKMIKRYSQIASEEKGYSFSFTTGNHFLLLAKDSETDEYYLVMHSSANEFKHSYMGLYPVEDNWYSEKVKHIEGENGRIFNYLKDEDARYFIRMVKNFQKYNEQIHLWLAKKINGGEFNTDEKWMYHHYYMPTSQSIAIGTFVEPIGAQIPIFSAYGKPVYLFEIGSDNFQINLGEKKGKVCMVPHGWGQEIKSVRGIRIDRKSRQLFIQTENKEYSSTIKSQEQLNSEGKQIREYENGEEFLKIGNKYIHGKIIKTLIPICEYSKNGIDHAENKGSV